MRSRFVLVLACAFAIPPIAHGEAPEKFAEGHSSAKEMTAVVIKANNPLAARKIAEALDMAYVGLPISVTIEREDQTAGKKNGLSEDTQTSQIVLSVLQYAVKENFDRDCDYLPRLPIGDDEEGEKQVSRENTKLADLERYYRLQPAQNASSIERWWELAWKQAEFTSRSSTLTGEQFEFETKNAE
ncbi:MAG: hypothetical protein WD200_00725 [Candidatus Andersenbacteria bacterium]